VILLTAAAMALMIGCQSTDNTHEESLCPVTVDATSWSVFNDIATRLKAGSPVPAEDYEAYMTLPGMSLWQRSLRSSSPSARKMATWLDAAFGEGNWASGKISSNQRMMVTSFRYSYDHRELVDGRIKEFEQSQSCRLDSLVRFWIDPANLPATPLSVHFLSGMSEVRIKNDSLIVDTGLLVAAGPDRVARQLASLLYRNHQVIPGGNPAQLEGAESLVQTWRVVTNQSVATWIEEIPNTEFRSDHPRLGNISVIPEALFDKAIRSLDRTNELLPEILPDPALLEARGLSLTKWFIGQNAFDAVGYCMASTIVGHLGADRLHEAARSVPGFLATYQEAALLNPTPLPLPGESGGQLYLSMPTFRPDVFQGLHELLAKSFPE